MLYTARIILFLVLAVWLFALSDSGRITALPEHLCFAGLLVLLGVDLIARGRRRA